MNDLLLKSALLTAFVASALFAPIEVPERSNWLHRADIDCKYTGTAVTLRLLIFLMSSNCLRKQVVIQFYDSVAKGEAFVLDGFANLAHDV